MRFRPTRALALLLLSCLALPAFAETVPLYGRFEKAFTTPADTPPFSEFSLELTSPSGKSIPAPGFFDGNHVYRVRFLPLEEGVWKYKTVSKVKALAEQAGSFEAKKDANAKSRFLKHGPIRVSKDGTHLEHVDGTPFFFLADTVWNGPLLSKKDHWDTFLEDRVAKHFTGIQFNMCAPWRTAPTNAEGQVAFSVETGFRINPEFYQRIDERMAAVESRGMLSIPVLLWAWGKNDAGQALPEADAIRLIQYQLARYAAHPCLWILNGDGRYEGEVAERWKRIGRAVFARKVERPDVYHSPVTLHPGGSQWPYANFRAEKWLDVYGYQSSHSDSPTNFRWIHSGPVAKEWKQEPVRPYINLEPPYEAHLSGHSKKPFDDHAVRRACYWSLLSAPVAGLTYGGHGIWSWQEQDGLPYDHPYTGMAKAWQQAKDLPGATSMKHMADFFTGVAWTTLRPSPEVLAEQPGANAPEKFVTAASSEDKGLVVLYLPAGGTVKLKDVPRQSKGQWFDPRTGERTPAQTDEALVYGAPDEKDWVLVLTK